MKTKVSRTELFWLTKLHTAYECENIAVSVNALLSCAIQMRAHCQTNYPHMREVQVSRQGTFLLIISSKGRTHSETTPIDRWRPHTRKKGFFWPALHLFTGDVMNASFLSAENRVHANECSTWWNYTKPFRQGQDRRLCVLYIRKQLLHFVRCQR